MDVADLLVTVGPLGRIIGQEALDMGMAPEAIHMVEDNDAAIAYLRRVIEPGNIVLIKGSRGMTMEQIVSALSASK